MLRTRSVVGNLVTTKRQSRVGRVEAAQIASRLEAARERLAHLEHLSTLCQWIDTVTHRVEPLRAEIAAIGALARQHNLARADQIETELDTPQFVSASRAVFSIMPAADRAAELRGRLQAAAERCDTARARVSDLTEQLEVERSRSQELAGRRWRWRSGQAVHAQWVRQQKVAGELIKAEAESEEANEAFQPLAAEADMLDIQLGAFHRANGGTPSEVYDRVEAHRQAVREKRDAVARLGAEILERREALELQLRSHLERARGWGLITTIPEGADAMVAAMEQTRDVAELETSQVECDQLERQTAEAARTVRTLEERLDRHDPVGS